MKKNNVESNFNNKRSAGKDSNLRIGDLQSPVLNHLTTCGQMFLIIPDCS